jgi:hypothetical protein
MRLKLKTSQNTEAIVRNRRKPLISGSTLFDWCLTARQHRKVDLCKLCEGANDSGGERFVCLVGVRDCQRIEIYESSYVTQLQ